MVPLAIIAARNVAAIHASDPLAAESEATPRKVSVRAVGGVGGGELGPALRLGLQDEYWFETIERHGVYFGATAGWLAHAGLLEIGLPLLQLDSAITEGRATAMVTLNLALGFAKD